MLSYAVKRIVRSWKLYASLILGMMLAATFFGGINVGADTIGKQALDAQLVNTPVDISLNPVSGGISVPRASFKNVIQNVQGINGVVSAESTGSVNEFTYNGNQTTPFVKAIQDSSILYQHLSLVSGREISNANESVINANSQFAQTYKQGQIVKYNIGTFYGQNKFNITLKIVGEVSLDTVAANTLGISPVFYGPSGTVPNPASTLIVSWDKTFSPLADWEYNQTRYGRGDYSITGTVNVYLDRTKLLSAFNIESSISQVQQIDDQVANFAALNGFNSSPNLISPLQQFSASIFYLRITFTIFSIPVFFVAWYVGRTVSQASFNLRRREIGLLMTKGFSQSQLFRHFIIEALLVGIIGGGLGLAAAVLLNPYFVQILSGGSQSSVFLSQDTAIATMIFTITLTILAIYSPARVAANMDPAKSLREYVYLEDTRPSRRRGAILAFSLGLYKITLLALGINFQTLGRYAYGVNFLLAIVLIIMAILDYGLNIIGPFLFLYGATQLSTGLATRFHRRFSSFSKKLVGDIASLASKSVFRNPRRVTALVFLVALIAGYSIWVIGDQASLQDYNVRQAEVQTGSDLRVFSTNNLNLSYAISIASQLRTWNNITGATPESDSSLRLTTQTIMIKAIDPATWRQGAFYEPDWFTGDINTVFQQLQSNSQTIVLDHGVASYYNIQRGGRIVLGQNVSLTVISLFGPDYSQQSPTGPFVVSYFQPQGWSYVPLSLMSAYPSILGSNYVLVKTVPGLNFTALASSIQRTYPSVSVSTAQTATGGTSPVVSNGVGSSTQSAESVIANGTQNVLRLGTIFAGLAASIGIGAVAYTGFKEREKETTMLAVRGLSYRQMLGLLATEVLPLVIYALILATTVGLITVRGDTLAQNSITQFSYATLLAPRRVIFPVWSLENIFAIVGLLFLGVFLPAITAARKDLSKMSRTVRFA